VMSSEAVALPGSALRLATGPAVAGGADRSSSR
jgi:hypothetical protein